MAPSAPLPSTSPPPGWSLPPPPAGPYGAPTGVPPPRRRSRALIVVAVVVVIVVILIVAIVAYVLLFAPGPAVQVGDLIIWAPDNVCGLNANPIYFDGYNSSTSSTVPLDLGVPNYNATACTLLGVITNTTGFVLSGVQVPLTIPGDATGSMNLTVTSPGSPFSGNLNLVFA